MNCLNNVLSCSGRENTLIEETHARDRWNSRWALGDFWILTSFSSVQSLSRVRFFVTPWTEARQASLSITNSRSSLKLMSIESVMLSSHLILCCPLLLPPSIFPSIRAFSNDSALRIRWPKYWSSASTSLLHYSSYFYSIVISSQFMKVCDTRKKESEGESESHSVMSDSLRPHGLYSPWNCPGQNTGVGSFSLLQGIFPTQGWNPGLPQIRSGGSLPPEPQGKPKNTGVGSLSLL